MSGTTTTRQASRTRGTEFVAEAPQVNLLPPEIRAARGLRSTQRMLGLVLVGVVGVCGLGYAGAALTAANAQNRLEDAQAETSRLMVEQAKYAEVPRVKSALSDARLGIWLGMRTEVQWKPYLDAITAVLPEGVSVDSLVTSGATPQGGAAVPASPLAPVSVGQITFTARSLTVPDTAAWIEALDSVPGLGGAWTSSVTVTAAADGTTYYEVAASVQILRSAYSDRFAPVEGEQ
jgi:Tfp pilus assembly protein PilN